MSTTAADSIAGSPSALETTRFFGKEQLERQLLQHMHLRRSGEGADASTCDR